ncbi:MAG TPA: hypothetical protein VNE41_00190, partial [Chitinophagaceae bacterium]|nr:hypothetical protein [Chitinophagaceae bacterium]
RLGKQRINWGKTLVWNPNDWFNTFNLFGSIPRRLRRSILKRFRDTPLLCGGEVHFPPYSYNSEKKS